MGIPPVGRVPPTDRLQRRTRKHSPALPSPSAVHAPRHGPVAVVGSALVALIALALGLVLVTGHHPVRGAALLIAAALASVVAVLARRR